MGLWDKNKNPEGKPEDTPPPAPSAEDLLAKMSELLDGKFKPFQDSVNARFTAMEEASKPKPVVTPPGEPTSVLDDEGKAFNERLGPLAVAHVELAARMTENEILSENSKWSEYFPEIRKTLANTPVQVKAGPEYANYVRNVVKMVVGGAAMEGGLKRDKQRFILEDASSSSNNDSSSSASQEDKDWLNFFVTTGKGKTVTRREYLTRLGHDVTDPKVLASLKQSWSQLQVIQ
jgi:hypothetical protein